MRHGKSGTINSKSMRMTRESHFRGGILQGRVRGPFSTVSPVNMRYEKYIEAEMGKRFEKEEEDYEDYTAPFFCVGGCRLPPGIKILECGRSPDGWTGGTGGS